MLNLSRKSIKAQEESTKATRRSTAATVKATEVLRDLMREEDGGENEKATPGKGRNGLKNQPPKK